MADWVVTNYIDISLLSIFIFMPLFILVGKVYEGQYSLGLILISVVICSAFWVISIPYIVISEIVNIVYKRMRK